jgi:limonene 1,2-monooxygenase
MDTPVPVSARIPAMRFGLFMAPFHPTGQNPTLALERDLDLIEHLDRLGFHEVWIGEHHSGGYEIIASPEVFMAVAAERTKHIRLGSGVNSLPYHHPLLLADRFVLLDHLTRGRVMLGCGPGQLTSDAHMLGIPADEQRPRMDESLDAIMALLRGETVTMETDGFVLRDARLQLMPYSDPTLEVAVAASISPTGARAAGKHGIGLLGIAATTSQGFDMIGTHWNTWNETAERYGHVADRSKWRLVGPMHLAETKEQARKDVEFGIVPFSKYFTKVLPAGPTRGETPEEILGNLDEDGFAVGGTPDDAIRKIESLVEASGGFGTFLMFGHDWASPEATKRSFELFAQYVMPHFTGQLEPPAASEAWVTGSGGEFVNQAANAIMKAIADHAAQHQPT